MIEHSCHSALVLDNIVITLLLDGTRCYYFANRTLARAIGITLYNVKKISRLIKNIDANPRGLNCSSAAALYGTCWWSHEDSIFDFTVWFTWCQFYLLSLLYLYQVLVSHFIIRMEDGAWNESQTTGSSQRWVFHSFSPLGNRWHPKANKIIIFNPFKN